MSQQDFNIKNHISVFRDGKTIFTEGDKGREMFVILKGEVEISQKVNNEPMVLKKMVVGDFFGEMSTIRGVPRVATATAVGHVECLRILPETFKTMIHHKPGFGIKIIKELCLRIENGNHSIRDLSMLHNMERIIVFLFNIATNGGVTAFEKKKIVYRTIVTNLAKQFQIDQESVGSILEELHKKAKIKIEDEGSTRFILLTEKLLEYT